MGSYECILQNKSLIRRIYNKNSIEERHRHRYEMNIKYESLFKENGMIISGKSPDGMLPEIVELPRHKWYLGVQFHPESIASEYGHEMIRNFLSRCRKDEAAA